MTGKRFLAALCLLLGTGGCTEGLRGVPMKSPDATGKIVATATTAEPGGLKVLWNGPAAGKEDKWRAWIAGSQEEYESVSKAAGVGRVLPIDFSKYVVIAEAGGGGVCHSEIVAIEAEASGLLRLRTGRQGGERVLKCILLATRIARIVAIPRRVLTATVVFMNGHAFEVPEVPFG